MDRPRKTSHLEADACLLLTAVIWGANIPVVKFATQEQYVVPLVFNAVRMIFSALALVFLAWLESRRRPLALSGAPWGRILLFTLVSGLIYPLLFMFGIERTTAANTALLLSSMPMWTAVFSRFAYGEKLPGITWIGLFVTFVGTVIVVSAGGKLDFGRDRLIGNFLVLAAAMTWATATVISRPLFQHIGPIQLACFSSVLTTPIQLLIVANQLADSAPRLLYPEIIVCLLFSGALSTGLAYGTWNFGVQRLGGPHAAVYQNVVTLVAVLGGWLVLKEPRLTAQWLGGGLTIAGLLIMRKGR